MIRSEKLSTYLSSIKNDWQGGQIYAVFTLNGFDDQERNLTLVKTDFQFLKLNFKPAILSRLSNYISRDLETQK